MRQCTLMCRALVFWQLAESMDMADILSAGGATADALMAIVEHSPDPDIAEARKLVSDLLK